MKKLLKYIFILFIVRFAYDFTLDLLDKRPIKFEHYKTNGSFEKHIKTQFLSGSNVNEAVKKLELSRARCSYFDKKNDYHPEMLQPNVTKFIFCEYKGYFFSFDPIIIWAVRFDINDNNNIIDIFVFRTGGAFVI